jgi:hypothetical protein
MKRAAAAGSVVIGGAALSLAGGGGEPVAGASASVELGSPKPFSAYQPGWLADDGVHVTAIGYRARTRAIANQVERC